MAGVGRRGFAAAAHAAMFAPPPTSRMRRPSADIPQSMDDYRANTPPLGALDPPAGMSSFIHLAHITLLDATTYVVIGAFGSTSLIMF